MVNQVISNAPSGPGKWFYCRSLTPLSVAVTPLITSSLIQILVLAQRNTAPVLMLQHLPALPGMMYDTFLERLALFILI
jgi:hypothetical protein